MDLSLETFLKAARAIGPILAAVPEVQKTLQAASDALKIEDQAAAKEALADVIADNDAAHVRLQAKLAAAAGK